MHHVCTVVVRWAPHQPVRVLALRDELVGRDFDEPDAWWPDRPLVVGGRDRVAGGPWCATDVPCGTTALVLNRPEKRRADDGAPARGVLPLEALAGRTPDRLDLSGMASFSVVLVAPDRLLHWDFDGACLVVRELGEGTHMVTSGGAEDGKVDRHLEAFVSSDAGEWTGLLHEPADDLTALVVRHEREDKVFATVFGQAFTTVPGALDVTWSRTPWLPDGWAAGRWP